MASWAREALERVRAAAALRESGRERIGLWLGDDAELVVAGRLDDLRRLDLLLGRGALATELGADLTPAIERDLEILDFERRPLPADLSVVLPRYTRASTSVAVLRDALRRRRARGALVARAYRTDPARAFDASDNDLLPVLALDHREAQQCFLLDTLVQWRALRRSPELADRSDDGDDDNSQGRLTTSGLLSSLELASLAQRAPRVGPVGALVRWCVANAPHGAPNTIYQASNLTLALLGREGHGLLGRQFLPVYAAVHTLYCADTPALVDRFVVEELCAGWPRAHAVALLGASVDTLCATGARLPGAWQRLLLAAERAELRVPGERAALLAHLRARCRPGRLRRAPDGVLLDHLRLALRLHACVCTSAPRAASLVADAAFGGRAAPAVFALAQALADGDGARVLACASIARRSLAGAARAERSGFVRARMLRLDRDLEHVLALALGDVVRDARARDPSAARRLARAALPAAVRGVVDSGLHQLGPTDAARVLARAAAGTLDEPRAIAAAAGMLAAALHERLRRRALAVHFAGVRVLLDPRAPDRLIKETALHPLMELAALAARPHARTAAGSVPVRVLVPPQRAFSGVVERGRSAVDARALVVARRWSPSSTLPDAAGLLLPERVAPPGYSHLMVLARDRGIGVLAVEDVAAARRALGTGPVYLEGDRLRRGAPLVPVRAVPRYATPTIRPRLHGDVGVTTLSALARLRYADARAIAGTKAATLAALLVDDGLAAGGAATLDGTVVPVALVASWLRAVGLLERWNDDVDPATMRAAVRRGLRAHLFSRSGELSSAGRALARALRVPGPGPRIARASGTAEDLPGKSDAGLSRSIAGLRDDAALVRAIVAIIANVWRDDAVAHQHRSGVSMTDVWPAILVQRDLGPKALVSGVAVSRGVDGALGAISYQAVRGPGGGVRGGRAEEGNVSPVEHVVMRALDAPLLSLARARTLGRSVLCVERLFHTQLEPGAGHAVDVEWLWTRRGLVLVQARALARC
ncbi:MAG: hypothetical protein HYS27_02985 [Deltaproteobacteria bacterium]|nr:hypothetical protein [Deltaproteobacteria bacterium]